MTKKQFNWLKNHQPFEVTRIEPYEEHKGSWQWCDIEHVEFSGEYFKVRGIQRWKNKAISYKIHRKNVRKFVWYNGILARYNTEGNTKK